MDLGIFVFRFANQELGPRPEKNQVAIKKCCVVDQFVHISSRFGVDMKDHILVSLLLLELLLGMII